MVKITEVHGGTLSFVKVVDRSVTLIVVPVPSGRSGGRALLLFVARSRGRGARWWSPTVALAGRPLLSFIEALRRVGSGGRGAAFKSKSGLFVAVRRKGSKVLFLLGEGGTPYASLRLSRNETARLSEVLGRALTWPPAELPQPLSWKAKEALFGRYLS